MRNCPLYRRLSSSKYSDDHKHNELIEKLQDYEEWRVPHVWVINPRFRSLEVLESGSLKRVDAFTLPEYGIEIRYDDLS